MTTTTTVRDLPVGAQSRYDALMRTASPAVKNWISQQIARAKAAGRPPTESELRSSASSPTSRVVLGSMNGQDIEALAFLVLMQAAKSAMEDVKAAMDHVRYENEKKKQQKDAMQKMAVVGKTHSTKDDWPPRGVAASTAKVGGVAARPISAPAQVGLAARDVSSTQDHLDTMGDMTLELQMRLQKAVAAQNKSFEMLSNVMKKLSDTRASVVRNLK